MEFSTSNKGQRCAILDGFKFVKDKAGKNGNVVYYTGSAVNLQEARLENAREEKGNYFTVRII